MSEKILVLLSAIYIFFPIKLLADDCDSGKTILSHEVVPDDSDNEAPGVVDITKTEIIRGSDTEGTLCISVGSIGFFVDPPTDNVSKSIDIGYLVEIDSENSFHFQMIGDSAPIKADNGVLWMNFSDKPDKLFDADFTVSAVDKAGNISEKSSPIRVTDDGSGAGCSTSGSESGSISLAFLLLTALWVKNNRRSLYPLV